jgi:hypothetical protein
MIEEIHKYARDNKLQSIEASYSTENHSIRSLYKKAGLTSKKKSYIKNLI